MAASRTPIFGSPEAESPAGVRGAVAALFAAQFVAADFCARGVRGLAADRAAIAHVVATALGWMLLGSLCSVPWRRGAVALLAAADLLVQAVYYRYYRAAIDVQVVTAALASWGDLKPVLARGVAPFGAAVAVVAALEYVLLGRCHGAFGWRGRVRWALLAGVVAAVSLGPARLAAREFSRRPGAGAAAAHIGVLPSTRSALPSVLFLLSESIRASDYCSAHGAPCPMAPEIDALLPGRFPLREMRSVSSYTAVSVGAMLSGAVPSGSRGSIERAPLLFDFMKSVRRGSESLSVAYWSAQTDSLFERSDLRGVVDSYFTVADLVGHAVGDEDEIIDAGVDRLLAVRVARELTGLRSPFVAVVHFQGTHAPYFVDEADAPFRPFGHVVTWSGMPELHNAYLDAIHEQDRSIATIVRAFLDKVGGAPYVILFTSDHGEAFGEHDAIHHGQNLFEEQTHVPAWIAAGNAALDRDEVAALASYEHALVTHLDLLPTLLDIEGIPEYESLPYRRGALGRSLVAPFRPLEAVVPLTNCTELFRCPLNTWGLLSETRELVAQPWDANWRCVALSGDSAPPGDGECARLRVESPAYFATLPNGAPNRAP